MVFSGNNHTLASQNEAMTAFPQIMSEPDHSVSQAGQVVPLATGTKANHHSHLKGKFMSNYQYNTAPSPEAAYGYPQQPPAPRGNGLGVAALVVGIVAIVLALIPLLGMVAFFLGPIAVILGVIGLFLKNRKKGTAITGVILGVVAVVIAGIWTAALSAGAEAVDKSLNAEHGVKYVVTTNGPANVSYWNGDGSSNKDIEKDWEKSFTADSFSLTSVTVSGDLMNESASVSCEVFVDGESVSKNTGEGAGAMATCSGDTL